MTIKDNYFNRVLFINPFGIGDVLFTTPVIRAVKENFPHAYIGYVCNRRTKSILEDNPNIDVLYIYEKDEYRVECAKSKLRCLSKFIAFLKSIKKEKFDLTIDLSLGRPYNFFSWLIGIKRRIGFNYKKRGTFLTEKIDLKGYADKHVVEHYLDLLNTLKLPYDNPYLEIVLSEKEKSWADDFLIANSLRTSDLIIGITPGGGASWGNSAHYLHWQEEKFAEVADTLIKQDKAKIILFGSENDKNRCEQVYNFMEQKPTIAYGKVNLKQFCALLGKCKLLLCNDTGPLHMAVAVGIKTVCIAGPVDEKVYGPYPFDKTRHKVVASSISCRPCYKKFKMNYCEHVKCLNDISAEEAYRSVKELI